MHNWSTSTKELRKNKTSYSTWKMEQLINFGVGKSKIKKKDLIKLMPSLSIDPSKKKYLSFLIWR